MAERRTPGGPFGALRALKAAIEQKRAHADDAGAALILALVFLIVAALTLTALVTFAGAGLLDTAGFTSQRGLQYGANGATEIAVQNVRYQTSSYPQLKNCLGTTTDSSVQLTEYQQTAQYRVYCQSQPVPNTTYSTATVSGQTVTTSRLFTAYHTSWIGYGISGAGIPASTSIVRETMTSTTVTLSQTTSLSNVREPIVLVSPFQRLVTFYTCRAATCRNRKTTNPTKPVTALTQLTQKSLLVKAVVGFGDRTGQTTVYGRSMIVTQWTVSSANH